MNGSKEKYFIYVVESILKDTYRHNMYDEQIDYRFIKFPFSPFSYDIYDNIIRNGVTWVPALTFYNHVMPKYGVSGSDLQPLIEIFSKHISIALL